MSETDLLINIGRRILARLRPTRAHVLPEIQHPEVFSTAGYSLAVHWLPHEQSDAPILLCCPDFPDASASFLENRYPFSCAEIHKAGYSLLIFDPAGRGKSWGMEDYGGLEHQDNVSTLLSWVHKRKPLSKIGVFSVGCGLSMAIGGITTSSVPVEFLMDMEGPSDEEFLAPIYALSKQSIHKNFWKERSPVHLLPSFQTPYIRIQAEYDHLHGYDMRPCNRVFRQLAQQQHPGFQLNNHPPGSYPPQPHLFVHDKRVITQRICALLATLNRWS